MNVVNTIHTGEHNRDPTGILRYKYYIRNLDVLGIRTKQYIVSTARIFIDIWLIYYFY